MKVAILFLLVAVVVASVVGKETNHAASAKHAGPFPKHAPAAVKHHGHGHTSSSKHASRSKQLKSLVKQAGQLFASARTALSPMVGDITDYTRRMVSNAVQLTDPKTRSAASSNSRALAKEGSTLIEKAMKLLKPLSQRLEEFTQTFLITISLVPDPNSDGGDDGWGSDDGDGSWDGDDGEGSWDGDDGEGSWDGDDGEGSWDGDDGDGSWDGDDGGDSGDKKRIKTHAKTLKHSANKHARKSAKKQVKAAEKKPKA